MDIQQAINTVIEGNDLTRDDMTTVMRTVMSGEATPAQVAGLLVALRMKGEAVEELTAAASVMRELSAKVKVASENLVDTFGTGGRSADSSLARATSAPLESSWPGRPQVSELPSSWSFTSPEQRITLSWSRGWGLK